MAVKQKVVDCVAQSDESRLQVILRTLQDLTAQGLQDKMCTNIVVSLGTIHEPQDPTSYKEFISNIKSVQDILVKERMRYDLNQMRYATLQALYHEIATSEKPLSPAMSIVLQLIDIQFIPTAVNWIFKSCYPVECLKRALQTLCLWLRKWTWTENLGPLVLEFMRGLEAEHYDILYEVILANIEPLFKLLILQDHRKSIGKIVLYMLSQAQSNPTVFHQIIESVNSVVCNLYKEQTESSLDYLRDIVTVCVCLMDHYPQYSNNYDQLRKDLEPYLPITMNYNNKNLSNDKSWMDVTNATATVDFSTGKVGLNNLGNTCYMNSVLQALFMTKLFRNEILLLGRDMTPLLTKLQALFALLQHSKRSSLSPNDVSNLAKPPCFLPGHQHDSSEFLGYLLDTLHEQEKTVVGGNCSQSDDVIGPTIVQGAFGGRTISVSRCSRCQTKSERVDNFRELQLAFPNNSDNQSVQTLLDYYLQPERLSGDNQYHCDVCHCLTDGERLTCIEEAPSRLILTLKHFRYDPASQQRTKLLQSIKLDNQVHLASGQYELYAAVVHCGSSVDSGHYYTFARDGDEWFKFNDCTVTRTVADELCGLKPPETPYILFYSRVDIVEPENLPRHVLSSRLQFYITTDHSEYDVESRRRSLRTYNVKQNRNDEPPPPGCGGAGFSNSSSNMYVC